MVYVYVIVIELFSFMSQWWGLWFGWWVNSVGKGGAMGMGLVVGRRGGYILRTQQL